MITIDTKYTTSIAIAIAIVLSSCIWGLFYYNAQSHNTLSVTGSAKKTVTSDLAKVTIALEKTVRRSELGSGYAKMSSDVDAVKNFLIKNGAESKNIVVTSVGTYKQYDNNNQSATDPMYDLNQSVEYSSTDVDSVTKLSQSVTSLSNQGIVVSIQSVQYLYSKLAEIRISLLGDAVKDATLRAENIAKSSGKSLGSIQSASSGVVQVSPINSVDISDYGNYDTSHIEKEVTVTVKAAYELR